MRGLLGREHFVELRHIENILRHFGLEFWGVGFRQHLLNVKIFEPRVRQDLVEATLGTQSLVRLLL